MGPRSGTLFDQGYHDLGLEGPLRGGVDFKNGYDHNWVSGDLPGGGRGHFSWNRWQDGTVDKIHFTPDRGLPETIQWGRS